MYTLAGSKGYMSSGFGCEQRELRTICRSIGVSRDLNVRERDARTICMLKRVMALSSGSECEEEGMYSLPPAASQKMSTKLQCVKKGLDAQTGCWRNR